MAAALPPPWSGPTWCDAAVVLAGASTEVLRAQHVGDDRALLRDGLAARHDRLARPSDRRDLLAGRALARAAVASLVGAVAAEVGLTQHCPTCGGGDHGAPSAAVGTTRVSVSWAHSGGHVAAAAAPEDLRVGVDVETGGDERWPGTTERERERLRSLPPHARPDVEFRRVWSAKEAWVKTGVLSLGDASRTDLADLNGHQGARCWTFDGPQGAVVGLALAPAGQVRC